MPDNPDLYDYLTGMQYLNFMADVFGVSAKAREARVREYGELFASPSTWAIPSAPSPTA